MFPFPPKPTPNWKEAQAGNKVKLKPPPEPPTPHEKTSLRHTRADGLSKERERTCQCVVCDSFAFERPYLRGPPEDHRHLPALDSRAPPGSGHLNSGWLWPGNRSRCVPTEDCVHFKEGHSKCMAPPLSSTAEPSHHILHTQALRWGAGTAARSDSPRPPLDVCQAKKKVWLNFTRVTLTNRFKYLLFPLLNAKTCDA